MNNAGRTRAGNFLELPDEALVDGFALKYHAAMRMTRLFWPMLKAAQGHVVNIVGGAARSPEPEFTIGGSVNAAMGNFSKGLSQLGKRDGINVNVIHPGNTRTERQRSCWRSVRRRPASPSRSCAPPRSPGPASAASARLRTSRRWRCSCARNTRGISRAPRSRSMAAPPSGIIDFMAAKSKVKAACVIGWPVEHSRSPLIHGYWIKQHKLNADYRREAVPPESFEEFVADLAERGYVGCNVTIPNKEAALRAVEGRRPRREGRRRQHAVARRRDAAVDQHRRRGLHQQSRCRRRRAGTADSDTVVVLGAGGTARAVVYGLGERGAKRIHVVNRTIDRAIALREGFGKQVNPARWEELGGCCRARACWSTRRRSA